MLGVLYTAYGSLIGALHVSYRPTDPQFFFGPKYIRVLNPCSKKLARVDNTI